MIGKLRTSAVLGLSFLLLSSALSPAWAKPDKDKDKEAKGPNKPPTEEVASCNTNTLSNTLGILANFCLGPYSGNDSGDKSLAIDYLNAQSPGLWSSYVKYDVDENKYSYATSGIEGILDLDLTSGKEEREGSFVFDFDKLGKNVSEIAISVKGGNGYVMYGYQDLEAFKNAVDPVTWDWETSDLKNKNGKSPGLSHLKVFVKRLPKEQPESVPEPMSILGLVTFGGVAAALKRKRR